MDALITGVGALSPLGLDLESSWHSILENKPSPFFQGLRMFSPEHWQVIVQRVKNKAVAKIAQISFLAATEAMTKAGWPQLNSDDGLILGTTTGQIGQWEDGLMEGYRTHDFSAFFNEGGICTPGESLAELSSLLNFKGKSLLVVSACSASTQGLGLAAEWVKSGRVKRCLVGGAEILTVLSREGFRCLGLLSDSISRPFDEKRSGVNLSEAAAFFCIEPSLTTKTGVAIIKAFATNSDAHHLTAPHPEGWGSERAFRDILRKANVKANQIDWVHAHGTGSAANDTAEAFAIEKVFGTTPVTSTKAYHGHALGASGAFETAICVEALTAQIRVKSLNSDVLDPLVKIKIQRENEKAKLKYIVKSSLGFGGINAAILLAHPSEVQR